MSLGCAPLPTPVFNPRRKRRPIYIVFANTSHDQKKSFYVSIIKDLDHRIYVYAYAAYCRQAMLSVIHLFSLAVTHAALLSPQHVFRNPVHAEPSLYRIPSVHESAVQARRVLNISSIATLSTVFPGSRPATFENRPDNVEGVPIGLMDYYALCGPQSHNPTILAIGIATSFRNARAGSNVTLSLRYHPPADHPPADDIYTYSPANLPRFSLIGHMARLTPEEIAENDVRSCFLQTHPDAGAWTPGNKIHQSWWARLIVEEIYWIGGFGDRAYIGWIPVNEWRAVSEQELSDARLVGEHGWHPETLRPDKV